MEKIRIISLIKYRERVVSILHDMRVMQLEPVNKDLLQYMKTSDLTSMVEGANAELQKLKSYMGVLPKQPVSTKKKFSSLEEALEEAKSIDLTDRLRVLKETETDISTDIKDIHNRMETIQPLIGMEVDLSIFNTAFTKSYIITSAMQDIDPDAIRQLPSSPSVVPTPNGQYVVTIPVMAEKDLAKFATEMGYQLLHIPELKGTPAGYYEDLVSSLKAREEALAKINEEYLSLAKTYYEKIAVLEEQLRIEVSKLEAAQRALSTSEAFAMEGWMKVKDAGKVTGILDRATAGSCLVSTVKTSEEPPTALSNWKRFRVFEFFIRFYSLPVESEFDPTMIFAFIFPFFFGLMVGDMGYGLVILLFAIWMVRKINHPETFSIVPKRISAFAVKILGKGPLLVLGKVLIPSSIIAIIVGFIFNGFFGFQILPFTILNPIDSYGIAKLLLVSGYIGLAMVSFGFVLGILNAISHGEDHKAISSGGWLMLAWGVAITGLDFLHKVPISLDPVTGPLTAIPVYVAILGIVVVAVFERGRGMIEVPSLISHILSYTRIVGILLASVILAYVVNRIFLSNLDKGFVFIILGGVILILGQIFNLAIAIFEPGIQGARLLYVEFFSKFYRGNGKQFKPFGAERKYTLPEEHQ